MTTAHRDRDFRGALILSLIVNLLMVGALLHIQQGSKRPEAPPTIVVALQEAEPETGRRSLPASRTRPAPAITIKRTPIAPPLTAQLPLRPSPVVATGAPNPPPMEPAQRALDYEASGLEGQTTAATRDSGQQTTALTEAGAGHSAPDGKTAAPGTDNATPFQHSSSLGVAFIDYEEPRYPALALRNGWEGTVLLSLRLDANGRVEQSTVITPSGHEILDHSALAVVRRWRFTPSTPRTVRVPLTFRLKATTTTPTPRGVQGSTSLRSESP